VHKQYLLGVLTIILLFNYVDRLALGLMLQDIKVDLDLTDTQLGFLSGIAFALFYAAMGIPIARWADRGNRVTIIALTAGLWSVMVALCGAAGNFMQLLLIRVGVAVGEAGCMPPALSLIADHFNRAERPRATSIYMSGGALSFVVGSFAAGWLNDIYGWRITFALLGVPGLVLAVLAWVTLKEPRRAQPRARLAAVVPEPTFAEVWVRLWSSVTFRHLLLCFSVMNFFVYGIAQWQPAFFIRSYGLSTGEIGTWFAGIAGVGGLTGAYVGGVWVTRHAAQNERLQLRLMVISFVFTSVMWVLTYVSTNLYLSMWWMGLATIALYATQGPLFATIQTLVPERMRAVAFALIYLFANLIGMGLGPLAAGAISDALRAEVGDESLRYALLILSPGFLWAAGHAWRASRTVALEVAKAQAEQEAPATVPERSAAELCPSRAT